MRTFKRLLLLAIGAMSCAAAGGLVVLLVFSLWVQISDGADGVDAAEVLANPGTWFVWLVCVVMGGCIGFGVSVLALWRVDLKKAIPAIFKVTLVASAVTGPLGPNALFPVLATACFAMLWCRGQRDRRSHQPRKRAAAGEL